MITRQELKTAIAEAMQDWLDNDSEGFTPHDAAIIYNGGSCYYGSGATARERGELILVDLEHDGFHGFDVETAEDIEPASEGLAEMTIMACEGEELP